jgi:hypothetical protein
MKHWSDCSLKEKIERWEHVITVLKAITPHERRKHWNMGTYGEETACGTIGCAAGFVARDPWFKRRGFKMVREIISVEKAKQYGYSDEMLTTWGRTSWEWRDGVTPESFFGTEGCEQVFFRSEQRSVSTVIKEVKSYIRELKAAA